MPVVRRRKIADMNIRETKTTERLVHAALVFYYVHIETRCGRLLRRKKYTHLEVEAIEMDEPVTRLRCVANESTA